MTLSVLVSLAGSVWGQTRFDSWKVIGQGGGGTMIAPTISPHDPHLVVEHCDMTGGYITQNDGDSWRMFSLRTVIETVAFDPGNKEVLYAGNEALWRSENRGKSWSMIFPDPRKHTVEHQVGDHSDIFYTTDDASYPGTGSISAIAIDPSDSKRVFVAFTKSHSTSAVYVSNDRGVSWKELAPIPQRAVLLTLHDGNLIALAGKGAYSISSEGNVAELGQLQSDIAVAAAAHAGNASRLYATTQDGKIAVSDNAGITWRDATPALALDRGAVTFHAISASEQHGEIAYAGFRPRGVEVGVSGTDLYNGIVKTVDAGRTWNIVYKESTVQAANLEPSWIEQRAAVPQTESIFPDAPWSLGVAPTDPNIAYATDLFRTYRTLDGGRSWKDVNSRRVDGDHWTTRGLDVTTIHGVQFDPFDPMHMFIDYTDVGLFQSQNGGLSWETTSSGVPEDWRNTTYWLAFDPVVKGLMWGAFSGVHDLPRPKMWRTQSTQHYTGGVAVSKDGGRHWSPSNHGMPSTAVTHILLDPESATGTRILYATAFGRGVYKSVDNGNTWAPKNVGLADPQPFAWRFTQDKQGTLYLVVARSSEGANPTVPGAGALYRSTDKAEHWVEMKLPAGVDAPTELTIDPRDSRRLYLTAWGHQGENVDTGGGVFLSKNAGQTWEPIFQQSQHVFDLAVSPQDPNVLYIAGFDAAAYRSEDRGAHWSAIKGYDFKWGYRVIPDRNDASKIYITTYGGGLWHGPAKGDPNAHEDILTPVPVAH